MVDDDAIKSRDRSRDSPFPSADDPELLDPILDELGADTEVRELAADIASTIESTMWVIGKRRSTVAATSVYVAGIISSCSTPLFKQKDVAEASSISIGSIFNQAQELQEIYQTLEST